MATDTFPLLGRAKRIFSGLSFLFPLRGVLKSRAHKDLSI